MPATAMIGGAADSKLSAALRGDKHLLRLLTATQVITDPAAVKEFMFGTELTTDWTVGAPIVWRGEWDGKAYEDKGEILEFSPGQRLVQTHFSPLGGQEDAPENYHTLTWTPEDDVGKTRLTLAQDNNDTAAAAKHSQGMWDTLVAWVKKIAERA